MRLKNTISHLCLLCCKKIELNAHQQPYPILLVKYKVALLNR